MKQLVLSVFILLLSFTGFSQDTTGLVAHWKMNGNALDATGHGHNGTMRNVTSAVGKGGGTNSALQFNGVNSYIMVPYAPSLDLTTFSICATINIKGFYSGTCHGNTILQKGDGGLSTTSQYALNFTDYNCSSAVDTTKEVFGVYAGDNNTPPSQWLFSPTLAENTWYSVVATFDGTTIKVYLNGVLKDSITTAGNPITANNDSLIIGMATWNATFPYPFKGIIDDIRLYNRPLTYTEITTYDTSTLAVPQTINNSTASMVIYPNPATQDLYINLNGSINGTLSLSDELGHILSKKTITTSTEKLDISALPPGIYFVRVSNDEVIITGKFLKQ